MSSKIACSVSQCPVVSCALGNGQSLHRTLTRLRSQYERLQTTSMLPVATLAWLVLAVMSLRTLALCIVGIVALRKAESQHVPDVIRALSAANRALVDIADLYVKVSRL